MIFLANISANICPIGYNFLGDSKKMYAPYSRIIAYNLLILYLYSAHILVQLELFAQIFASNVRRSH